MTSPPLVQYGTQQPALLTARRSGMEALMEKGSFTGGGWWDENDPRYNNAAWTIHFGPLLTGKSKSETQQPDPAIRPVCDIGDPDWGRLFPTPVTTGPFVESLE